MIIKEIIIITNNLFNYLGLEAVRAAHDGVDDDPPEDLALARLHPRCLGSEKRERERKGEIESRSAQVSGR